ncbi:MAG: hypothetical protein M3552_07010 [Planctomycetota bacterium]|nr:hypothetical protein [Planctomycetaceae bacterium]MDQ3330385.1 hypothetical protein [Planctomycetota bacterium]
MKQALPFIAFLFLIVAIVGCDNTSDSQTATPNPTSNTDNKAEKKYPTGKQAWWTLAVGKARDALGYSLEVVHDGSGWILGKATVNIEQIGDARDTDDGKVADFRIAVTSSDESFTSEVKNIPCDEFGIPNHDAQIKFDEAVTRIKEMLDKIQ